MSKQKSYRRKTKKRPQVINLTIDKLCEHFVINTQPGLDLTRDSAEAFRQLLMGILHNVSNIER